MSALAGSKTFAARGPKSLMKTSELGAGGLPRGDRSRSQVRIHHRPGRTAAKPASSVISGSQQQKIEERIAAATEELSAGITEAASAAEELRRSMEQIASGAEEAASAAQETLAVADQHGGNAGAGARPGRRRTPTDRGARNPVGRDVKPDRNLGRQHQA